MNLNKRLEDIVNSAKEVVALKDAKEDLEAKVEALEANVRSLTKANERLKAELTAELEKAKADFASAQNDIVTIKAMLHTDREIR